METLLGRFDSIFATCNKRKMGLFTGSFMGVSCDVQQKNGGECGFPEKSMGNLWEVYGNL
jgi:hypothetical protein